VPPEPERYVFPQQNARPQADARLANAGFEPPQAPVPGELVDVRPLKFESFDKEKGEKQNQYPAVNVINNIPLVVSAELGTTQKNLSEVLAFKPGISIILDKAAGDPVEIMVNGKFVARGEVVVIDDNYGIRITDLPNK
jgi:flagellar motor switch protein FliN/FliY